MSVRKSLDKIVQENYDYKKNHEFFSLARKNRSLPEPVEKRQEMWQQLCQSIHYPPLDFWVEYNQHNQAGFIMLFQNGLAIEDKGNFIYFNATENKSNVDMLSAISFIQYAANHLYRHGWRGEVSTNRRGSTPMVKAFEDSYKRASQTLTKVNTIRKNNQSILG